MLTPLTLVPLSQTLGRSSSERGSGFWIAFYATQALLAALAIRAIAEGSFIEWVTGILDQPIILVRPTWRYAFLNVILSTLIALMCFDKTLQQANSSQKNELKFFFIPFVGFGVYFSYLSVSVLWSSYVSAGLLQTGAPVVLCGLFFLAYGVAKYPFWEVKIRVSRHLVFGSFTVLSALFYLILCATVLDLLRLLKPGGFYVLFPAAVIVLVGLFLAFYLSPHYHAAVRGFLTRHFFRNKYDYRDMWMRFSEKSAGSLNIREVLPRIAEFLADAMFVRQVVFWLRSNGTDTYHLAYAHTRATADRAQSMPLRLDPLTLSGNGSIFSVPSEATALLPNGFPTESIPSLKDLAIERLVLVRRGSEVLAIVGIGLASGGEKWSAEDDQFLLSVSNQLSHLIMNHKLSEELLLSREWESFNRFASFILHDLKNLATLQGMTLENAKHLSDNPNFIADAFETFKQTTDKMISLIASLSVQRGQFSLKQKPVSILEVLATTFDDLKIGQRNGIKVLTRFPSQDKSPIVSGDAELLQKAFTNLLLNAIQSLPQGQGAVEVAVSEAANGRVVTSIRDNGCGIPPERLETLFRPFQTTKKNGTGIGLCHTRSIIEVHGGQLRIESQVNAGTRVEVELPTLSPGARKERPSEAQDTAG
ncbi:MAG TPA: ATP-binding protein [Candidatus Binatia bacterium]|nr:ATP-binding protein [Candidatus Binatia bacterium]